MTSKQEVYIYETDNFEKTLFLLVEKIYNSNESVLIYSPMNDRVVSYDQMLWTFKKVSFIPHAIFGDVSYEKSNIILSSHFDLDINTFNNVILMDHYDFDEKFYGLKKVIFIINSNNNIFKDGLLKKLYGMSIKHFKETKGSSWELVAH